MQEAAPSPGGSASNLDQRAVPRRGVHPGGDDARRPVRQPVVDGDHECVFEQLRQQQQDEQEQPGGGQVGAAGAPGDGGALAHHLGQDVVFALHRLLWDREQAGLAVRPREDLLFFFFFGGLLLLCCDSYVICYLFLTFFFLILLIIF